MSKNLDFVFTFSVIFNLLYLVTVPFARWDIFAHVVVASGKVNEQVAPHFLATR